MSELKQKQEELSKKIFKEVIEMKTTALVSTKDICNDLNLEEEEVSNYFLGMSKNNLPLGIMILNYLEEKYEENIIKNSRDN